jgi:hypothetical protein
MNRVNGRRVVITQTSAFMGKDLIELFCRGGGGSARRRSRPDSA